MDSNIKKEKCEFCGEYVPSYGTIYVAPEKEYLCSCLACFNKRMAEYSDTDFDHVDFEPIILKDTKGVEHEFHFTVRHLGDRIGIDSFEIKDGHRGGYEFSLIGGIDKEIFDLFGKLFERMRRGLNRDHLEWSSITNNWQISKGNVVRARIDSDLESYEDYGHPPLIVIDGKEIRWDEFGRMLMTYEGFNFKLEIFDRSEEMP
ncbi:MAG: hypothetical protein PVG73_05535 [Desulfobacterales bacterium]|jgi:hypothetical protein